MSASSWDETFSSGRDFPPLNRFFLKKLFAVFQPTPKTALDLGCGTGEDVAMLLSAGISVTGIDGSLVALEKARARAGNERATFLQRDFETLQAADMGSERFDLILSKLTIAFIQDHERFLTLVHKLLPLRGAFVLITPVTYARETYADPRVKKISVGFDETLALLKRHFKNVSVFHEDFGGSEEVKVTFLARK